MRDSVKERITTFCKVINISKSEFGRRIGVSETYIGSIRKSIQPDKIKSIVINFPELNISWLLTGIGEMLNRGDVKKISDIESESQNYSNTGSTINLIERIKSIISIKSKSVRAFALEIDFPYNTLNQYVLGKRSSISINLIEKIIYRYEDINPLWLLSGKGAMIKADTSSVSPTISESLMIPREIFNSMSALIEAVSSQQRTIEELSKKLDALATK